MNMHIHSRMHNTVVSLNKNTQLCVKACNQFSTLKNNRQSEIWSVAMMLFEFTMHHDDAVWIYAMMLFQFTRCCCLNLHDDAVAKYTCSVGIYKYVTRRRGAPWCSYLATLQIVDWRFFFNVLFVFTHVCIYKGIGVTDQHTVGYSYSTLLLYYAFLVACFN